MQIKLLTLAVAFALAGTVQAQTTTKQDRPVTTERKADAPTRGDRKAREAEEDKIEADAKAAKAKCEPMKGQEKDICQQQAKSDEKVKKAELDAKYDPSPRKLRKVDEQKAEAEYEVAKAKCDLQTGKADNACKKEAKAKYDRAKADIKAKHAKAEAKRERTAGSGASGDNTPNRDLNRNGR